MSKAILFINGNPPQKMPKIEAEDTVICTDGAYNYLHQENIRIDILIGDLDSIHFNTDEIRAGDIIKVENQNYTDIQKALQYLAEHEYTEVYVYGGAGKEQDHFLGNLTAAYQFKDSLQIVFYEDSYRFWLLKKQEKINMEIGKILSLYPFPLATEIETEGLQYPLHRETLDMYNRIGIRNKATSSTVSISFTEGDMWVFVYH